ncbi:MAG: SUMF1/EgtB/PvdO family nonheme iron enzyme [Bacteroidota bacterium]|nr:SUMF1/EgtB/PvdO family nonheme iron enzyme [Bacteroidota bacterium]
MKKIIITALVFIFIGCSENKVPPGTVQISDNLYIDKTEISNFAWQEYLIWLKGEYGIDSEKYKNGLPDKKVWSSLYKTEFKLIPTNQEIREYPIVGIDYEQAIKYCKWRTFVVNKKYEKNFNVNYRLPTKEEYISGQNIENLKNKKKYFNPKTQLYKLPDKIKGKHTIFLSTNVSEMTNEKGKAYGANFSDTSNLIKDYSDAEIWLGFRCVAQIVE